MPYTIPTSLELTVLDTRITPAEKQAPGFSVELRQILVWMCVIIGGAALVTMTPMGSRWYLAVGTIVWILLFAWMFLRADKFRRFKLWQVVAAFRMLPKSARLVDADPSAPVGPIHDLTGVKSVDTPLGVDGPAVLNMVSGRVGMAYQVVGNASTVLFERDAQQVVESYEVFLRRCEPDWLVVQITVRRAQSVHRQIDAAKALAATERVKNNAALSKLVADKIAQLEKVGRVHHTTQQAMLVTASDLDSLRSAQAMLQQTESDRSLALRDIVPLTLRDVGGLLGEIYGGRAQTLAR
ncbi:MAG: hypothetical protein LBG60_13225 [Bifidobacteriaceae bacterium]|jgi:hypothetical protein|nr:hypothetical protein [Bifidobacteriaceae bacterium]